MSAKKKVVFVFDERSLETGAPKLPEMSELAPARGSEAAGSWHTCAVCGHAWRAVDGETSKKICAAVKVNGEGPKCGLCMHLEMAYRYAEAQGYRTFSSAVEKWLNTSKPLNKQLSKP